MNKEELIQFIEQEKYSHGARIPIEHKIMKMLEFLTMEKVRNTGYKKHLAHIDREIVQILKHMVFLIDLLKL